MSIRKWLVKKVLGFDPDEYETKMKVLVDGMSSAVADAIIAKEDLKKEIMQEREDLDLPSDEWYASVQNAIKILDDRTEDMANYISSHEEALEHIFSDDDSITLTQWGLVSNNKHAN